MFRINAKLIRGLLFERRLSLRQFALQSGLNPSTAAKVTKDGAAVSCKTISDLAAFFGVDGNSLIVEKE